MAFKVKLKLPWPGTQVLRIVQPAPPAKANEARPDSAHSPESQPSALGSARQGPASLFSPGFWPLPPPCHLPQSTGSPGWAERRGSAGTVPCCPGRPRGRARHRHREPVTASLPPRPRHGSRRRPARPSLPQHAGPRARCGSGTSRRPREGVNKQKDGVWPPESTDPWPPTRADLLDALPHALRRLLAVAR